MNTENTDIRESEGRIGYIDIAKGILILLMLIGHIWRDGFVHDAIYTFHMPAFFLLSGLLFQRSSYLKKPFMSAVLGKIRTLLVPYLFFEVFGIVMRVVQFGPDLSITGYACEILSLHLYNGPLWFLFVMLLSEVLFLTLYKLLKGFAGPSGYILAAALFIALLFLPEFSAYVNITTTILALFFLLLGFLFSECAERRAVPLLVIAAAVVLLAAWMNHGVGMPDYQEGYRILFVLSSIAGSYLVLQVSHMLSQRSMRPLEFYGQNSLILLGTHYPILRMALAFFDRERFSLPGGLAFLMGLLVIEIPLILIINRFLPFAVGKRRTK